MISDTSESQPQRMAGAETSGTAVALEKQAVTQGDRLDNITAKFLGDPEQFWRVCDANNAMRPDELTEIIGRTLRITLPEGIPAQPNV